MATVTVTRRGRTIIPVELRKKYGIEEGSALEVEDTGRGILLKKAKSTLDLLGTGRRSQREVFTPLDTMREDDERIKTRALRRPIHRSHLLSQGRE